MSAEQIAGGQRLLDKIFSFLSERALARKVWHRASAVLASWVIAVREMESARAQAGEPEIIPMLNWRVRYSKILDRHRDLFDPKNSILEVGSGNVGIAHYLKRPVVGLEKSFSGRLSEYLTPVVGDILHIPFADQSFDVVVCVDVLEHLKAPDRKRALSEIIRVARDKVIISCPCGHLSEVGERHLEALFRSSWMRVPQWLVEHQENGLPSVGSIFAYLVATDLQFSISGNERIIQHYAGILLDHFFFGYASGLNHRQEIKSPFASPVGEGQWDSYYSFLFEVNVTAAHKENPVLERRSAVKKAVAPSVRLYAVYHLPWPTEHLGRIIPIFAGSAADIASAHELTDILRGERRLANHRWSELSAYYRVWREGPRSDVIGFCHYRRLFDFNREHIEERETVISLQALEEHRNSFFDLSLLQALDDNTIICAKPSTLPNSIFDQYDEAHNIDDYCWVLNRMAVRYPILLPEAARHFESNQLYANNMFVARWELFDEICHLWFELLREFENEVPGNRGTAYQNRDISFLSERVFDIWVHHRKSIGTRILELPIFFLDA